MMTNYKEPPIELTRELLHYLPRLEYNDWIRVIAAVGNTYDEKTALNLLLEHFQDEKPNEHETKLRNRLDKNITYGTLVYYAKQYGFNWKFSNYAKYKNNFDNHRPAANRKRNYKQPLTLNPNSYNKDFVYSYDVGFRKQRAYRVAINTNVIDKNLNPNTLQPFNNYYTLNGEFRNDYLTLDGMINHIKKGNAIIFAELKTQDDGTIIRKSKYFSAAELFALDFDSGLITIDNVLNHYLTKHGGLMLYTTASHTEHKPRFRVVFEFDFVLKDLQTYENIVRFFINGYNAVNNFVDKNCTDGTRIFYGNRNAKVYNLRTGEIYV